MIELRDYQRKDVDKIRDAFKRNNRILYTLPTGGGKTVIFSYIAKALMQRGMRVAILMHRRHLVEQTIAALTKSDIYASRNGNAAVVVSTIQGYRPAGKRPDIVIIDEAHHSSSKSYVEIMNGLLSNGTRFILGVSATPERLDGRGLDLMFDELVEGHGAYELMSAGYLSDVRILMPSGMHDELQAVYRAKEFTASEKTAAANSLTRLGDSVKVYRDYLDGKRAIAFCYSIADAERMAATMQDEGIPALAVHGKMHITRVASAIARYKSGEINVLTSCDLISEGFDVPDTDGVMLARATSSLTVYLQQIGRALRPKSGGGKAIVIDMVGNVLRHGHPFDKRIWDLQGRKKRNKAKSISIRRCKACYAVNPQQAKKCKECGANLQEISIVRGVKVIKDVDFVEADIPKGVIKPVRTPLNSELGQLKQLELRYGYKRGWAEHRYRALQKIRRRNAVHSPK